MNNGARLFEKMLRVADHPVIKTGAHCEQHVTILHRHIGFIGAVHAQHSDKLAVGCRIRAQPHQRVGAGKTKHLGQLRQLCRRVAQYSAAPHINHRPLGA